MSVFDAQSLLMSISENSKLFDDYPANHTAHLQVTHKDAIAHDLKRCHEAGQPASRDVLSKTISICQAGRIGMALRTYRALDRVHAHAEGSKRLLPVLAFPEQLLLAHVVQPHCGLNAR